MDKIFILKFSENFSLSKGDSIFSASNIKDLVFKCKFPSSLN